MKSALSFWNSAQLRRSGIFVVPCAAKFISPVWAASSGIVPDDVTPGRSLNCLWIGDSIKMSALMGLTVLVPMVTWWLIGGQKTSKLRNEPNFQPKRNPSKWPHPTCSKPFQGFSRRSKPFSGKKRLFIFMKRMDRQVSTNDSQRLQPNVT